MVNSFIKVINAVHTEHKVAIPFGYTTISHAIEDAHVAMDVPAREIGYC